MKNVMATAVVLALIAPVAVQAETVTRPTAVVYKAPSNVGALRGGARAGAPGRGSALDDGGDIIIVGVAAGVAGYFLYDIIHDDNNHSPASSN